MARRIWPFAALAALTTILSGCGMFERPQRPAWRGQAENICLAEKRVQASPYVRPARAIDGPGICGLDHPFKVSALAGGSVTLNATQTIGCPLTAALDQWVTEVVQPVAKARFGEPVVAIDTLGAYSCRPIDNIHGAHLSEHSFGNAIDIGGFRLASGHRIEVVRAWTRGDDQEKAFLREVQAGACNIFTTILAPGSDMFHYNHIHLDLAMHGATSTGPRRICRPRPKPQLTPAPQHHDGLPDAPDIDEDVDISQAASPPVSSRTAFGGGGPDVAVPPAPPMRRTAQSRPVFRIPDGLTPPAAIGSAHVPPRSAAPRPPATLRPDGVYVPEGDPGDWDVTSSIRRR